MIDVKVISINSIPKYATPGSAGCDLFAYIKEPIEIKPLERVLISTGLCIELPNGYEAQVRPRSGSALLHGLTVLNSPGTIDSDYRGEIGVILVNLSNKPCIVMPNQKIAQLVFAKHETANFIAVDELEDTERGDGGFGHTGI